MITHNQVAKLQSCPTPVAKFAGVYLDMEKAKHIGVRAMLPCGSWSCPYCRQRNLKRLQYRIFNGAIAQNIEHLYGQKFLTLTCPGKEYRTSHTPLEAHAEMQKNFAKLIKALKKRFGEFFYLKVVEKHKDGFPHIHALLSGLSIAHKTVKNDIDKLWQDKYGMGFTWIVHIKKGFRAGIKYITKYIVKDLVGHDNIRSMGRYKRIFTASKGALVKIDRKKQDWISTKITAGYIGSDAQGKPQIFEQDLFDNPKEFTGDKRLAAQQGKLNAFVDFVLDNFCRPKRRI